MLIYKPAAVSMLIIKNSFNQRFKYFMEGDGSYFFFPFKLFFDVRNLNLLNWQNAARIKEKRISVL